MIRQNLLHRMLAALGFPKGLVSVEKQIASRRYDIVCFSRKMEPLLLVECKAGEISEKAFSQALGYNFQMAAPFICLAGEREVRTFWYEGANRVSVPFLPGFAELCRYA